MNKQLAEGAKVSAGGMTLVNAGVLTGRYFDMARYDRVQIAVYIKPASGTDAAAITLTQRKKTDDSPTSAKTLAFTKARKQLPGTDDTNTVVDVTGNSITTSATAQEELWLIDVRADALDVNNGFSLLRANVSDPGSVSTPCAIIYTGYPAGYGAEDPPNAIVA